MQQQAVTATQVKQTHLIYAKKLNARKKQLVLWAGCFFVLHTSRCLWFVRSEIVLNITSHLIYRLLLCFRITDTSIAILAI